MRAGDRAVPRIEHRALERAVEQLAGCATRYWSSESGARSRRRARRSPRARRADPLPGRRPRAGIADEHADVEAADVDPQLERARRKDGEQLAREKLLLDRAPLLGEVARAVRRDLRVSSGASARATVQQLGDRRAFVNAIVRARAGGLGDDADAAV
jgi:hypothetical protein